MDATTIGLTAFGSITAVVLPVLRGLMSKWFPVTTKGRFGLPAWAGKYIGLAIFGFLTAFVVLAITFQADPDTKLEWYSAFLLGFGAESTIEKFTTKPAAP